MIRKFIKNSYYTFKSFYKLAKSDRVCIQFPQRERDDIFVIANGPSVKEQISQYPNMCINRDVMCMNYIANADFYEKLRPKYYIIADPNDFTPSDMCSKELVEARTKGLDNIISKTSWEMSFFIPDFARESELFQKKIQLNGGITTRYFPTTTFNGFEKIHFFFLSKGMVIPGMQSVLIGAIYLAIIMGYKNIYLLGAEQSRMKDVRCDEDNRVYVYDRHSYGAGKRYMYKDAYGKVGFSMYELLRVMAEMFRQHNDLQNFAKYVGANIYNVTPGSYIDVYERKKIEDVLYQ